MQTIRKKTSPLKCKYSYYGYFNSIYRWCLLGVESLFRTGEYSKGRKAVIGCESEF